MPLRLMSVVMCTLHALVVFSLKGRSLMWRNCPHLSGQHFGVVGICGSRETMPLGLIIVVLDELARTSAPDELRHVILTLLVGGMVVP